MRLKACRSGDLSRRPSGAIRYFGPAFFTKFLYLTADQDRVGHALILDDRVRVAWRILAGYYLRNDSSEDYARYCTEAGQAGQRLGLSGSEVEACLYHLGRKVSSYEKWLAANLRLCQTRLADRAPTIADVVAEFDRRS